jgi:hypothetical protein
MCQDPGPQAYTLTRPLRLRACYRSSFRPAPNAVTLSLFFTSRTVRVGTIRLSIGSSLKRLPCPAASRPVHRHPTTAHQSLTPTISNKRSPLEWNASTTGSFICRNLIIVGSTEHRTSEPANHVPSDCAYIQHSETWTQIQCLTGARCPYRVIYR